MQNGRRWKCDLSIIEADNLTKQYDGVRALDDVSFRLEAGEVFALVGPNGAGKTTLLRLLTGILRPDGGSVRVLGSADPRASMDRVGYMPEERGLYKSQSSLETVAYFAALKGMGRGEALGAAARALEMVGMSGHARRKVEELSKGMSQRVQFAATIAHQPELLILDEPFSGLDPVSSRALQSLVLAQREAGHSVLLSTHNMAHAEALCDRLLMLHRGKTRLYGAVADIREQYTDHSLHVEYTGALPDLPGARVEAMNGSAARLYPQDGVGRREILGALVASGVDVRRFEPVEPSLEEIFVRVVGAEGEQAMRISQGAPE